MKTIDKYTRKVLKNNDKYVIFYSDWCGYCETAIDILKNNNISFKGYKIDKVKGGINTLLQKFKKTKHLTNFNVNHKARPIIFKEGKYFGGCNDLIKLLKKKN